MNKDAGIASATLKGRPLARTCPCVNRHRQPFNAGIWDNRKSIARCPSCGGSPHRKGTPRLRVHRQANASKNNPARQRSEEHWIGKELVSTGSSRGWTCRQEKNNTIQRM